MAQTESSRTLNLFGFMILLFWMALYAYQPQLSVYAGTLGAGISMTGVILSSYGLTQMLLRLPTGILSDMMKKRKLFILFGNIFAVLSALGLFFAKTPVMLLIFRMLSGAAASLWVVMTVTFSGYYPKEDAPKAMSRLMIFNKCGCLLGMVLGGVLSDTFSVKASFIMSIAAAGAALVLGLYIKEPDMTGVTPLRLREFPSVLGNRSLILFSIMALMVQVVEQGTTLGFVPKYASELGASGSALGILSGASIFGGMCASYALSGWLLRRFKAGTIVTAGCIVFTLTAVLLPFLAKTVSVIIVFQFLAGFGNTLCFALLNGFAISGFDGRLRGAAMGVFQSVYALGMFLGPLLTGVLSDHFSIASGIAVSGLLGGIPLILLSLFAFRRKNADS
ncbi:MAG: MFS transporter [Lachnospiraceae bacterium]|nr:MFS transporter [Lachnospiraceae bacterium]